MKRYIISKIFGLIAIALFIVFSTFAYYTFTYFREVNEKWLPQFRNLVTFEFLNDIHGIIFYIPIIITILVFGLRQSFIVWLLSSVIILPHIMSFAYTNNGVIVKNLFYLAIPILIIAIIKLETRIRLQERQAIVQRETERQAFMSQILRAMEDERRRIARELHDDTMQKLWFTANCVQDIITEKMHNIMPQLTSELISIKGKILDISQDLRRLSLALRPEMLDDLGFVSAIRWHIDQLNNGGPIEARMLVKGHERRLNHDISTHLFRITQEAINNVKHHSQAAQVFVKLEFKSEIVKMTIRDNGRGFILRDKNEFLGGGKLGIIGIQERVRLLGGIFRINSKPGKGTTLSVEISG